MANEINQIKVGSTTYTLQDSRVDSLVTGVSSVNSKTGAVSLGASDVGALSASGGNVSGHIYLTGAKESSSTGSTSQIVFGTSSNNHVAVSSNANALVINPTTSTTTNQIVLYLDKASVFPNGISGNASSATTAANATKLNGQEASYYAKASDIPTVNNATLTIQKNGTNVATFTANASSNATANITVPTKVSELTNDSKFVTADQNMTIKWGGSISTNPAWMLAWSDSGSTIQGVSPSTITAGNATKLDGQAASYYATKDVATTSAAGLMSKDDKTKLDGISDISQLDLWYGEVGDLTINSDGITWSDDFALLDTDDSTQLGGNLSAKVPIVAGSNIAIIKNANGKAAITYTCGTWSSGASGTLKLSNAGTYQVRYSNGYTSVLWWNGTSTATSPLIRINASGTCYRFYVAPSGTLTLKEGTMTTGTETNSTATIYYRRIGD